MLLAASGAAGVGAALTGPGFGTPLATAGATSSPDATESSTTDEAESARENRTVVIAALARPNSLDPGLAVDTETERILRQVFETLITIDTETGSISPMLASDYEISDDQLTYTFTLREDVQFHDGTELTAEAVVQNLQRLGRLDQLYGSGTVQSTAPLAFPSVFGGFTDEDSCILDSVEAVDEYTVELQLSEPISFLLQALTLPAFGIASPEVLSEDDPTMVARHPSGTGPYRVSSAYDAEETTLELFEDYWQTVQGPEAVTVRALPRSFDRLRELNRGTVDVYDGITADNLRSLVQSGRLLLQRDPFSVLYLGFNLDHPVMADKEIREAAAYAINRNALVDSLFLEGTRPAHQFTPPALGVQTDAVPRYSYQPSEAQQLLEDSSYDGEPLPFYYPIHTTRSYLPRPEAVYAAVARDLATAGFRIQPKPVVWDEGYVDQLLGDDDRAFHLLGRNGGYRSPHSFLGPLFGARTREFQYSNDDVVDLISEARAEEDDDARILLYQEAAELIGEDLPALPLAFPISGLALGPRVSNYPMSPVLNERFRDIVMATDQ